MQRGAPAHGLGAAERCSCVQGHAARCPSLRERDEGSSSQPVWWLSGRESAVWWLGAGGALLGPGECGGRLSAAEQSDLLLTNVLPSFRL